MSTHPLQGKTILITGGTGSFGRTMVDHLLRLNHCREIRIFSRDEEKQEGMRIERNNPLLKFYIGDVRDPRSVAEAMGNVDLVFHAAALKQVPSCEFFPLQAVATNVLGSANVIQAAVEQGVERVVCLSTDKAVMPINAMGMTKALMEKVAVAQTRNLPPGSTVVCSVRYGNVMYSRGSVIPLFVRQIRSGQPLTVTDPAMTRFMLSLADAVELVEFAFTHARQGDIFIRKAPACTIGDLVTALKELFGADNPVKVIGVRHGEKLHETLALAEELQRATELEGYFRVAMDSRDLNYRKYFNGEEVPVPPREEYNSGNTTRLEVARVRELLLTLPEIRRELAEHRGEPPPREEG